MKKLLTASILSTSLICGVTNAQPLEKLSAHADLGIVKFNTSKYGISDSADTVLSVGVGYDILEDVTAELSYNDFGGSQSSSGISRNRYNASFSSISFALIGNLPLKGAWALTGKLGVEQLKGGVSAVNGRINSTSDIEPLIGVGLNYTLKENIVIRGNFDLHDGSDIKILTAGVKYHF